MPKKSTMPYYKITNETETHNGLKYKTGLNLDPRPWNPSGNCEPGGIYFSREDILAYLDYGCWLRKVTLPPDTPIYANPGTVVKWKAPRVILGRRVKITAGVIRRLIAAGADVHVYDDWPLCWASENGRVEVVKVLKKAMKTR